MIFSSSAAITYPFALRNASNDFELRFECRRSPRSIRIARCQLYARRRIISLFELRHHRPLLLWRGILHFRSSRAVGCIPVLICSMTCSRHFFPISTNEFPVISTSHAPPSSLHVNFFILLFSSFLSG